LKLKLHVTKTLNVPVDCPTSTESS